MSDRKQLCNTCGQVHDILSDCDPMDRILKLEADINTLEGTLENIQDDNVAKEGRIATLEAELEKHLWIPVGFDLPKESGMYQVFRQQNQLPSTRYYHAGHRKQWESNDVVTHWKEVIEPEESEQSND